MIATSAMPSLAKDALRGRHWVRRHDRRFESDDGCVVKIDQAAECNTAKPWLKNYRGWIAYGPGDDQFNYLGFYSRNSRLNIRRKFKTAEAAMAAIDAAYPPNV